MSTKTLVVLVGPTGIGKTSAGIKIAEHFQTEIISADSRQIYKEMSIGTAVPSKKELSRVKHHFIHSHSVFDNYNASRYETEVLALLPQLFKKFGAVLLVGGSMLYVDAVCEGIDKMPDADLKIREKLKKQLKHEGISGLRLQLKKLDPDYYSQVDLKNPNRIIHALEICITTGKPYSSFRSNQKKPRPFSIIKIGLDCDRTELHDRINHRVDKMIEDGLETEARKLFKHKNLTALNTVGYRELFAYFDGEIPREKAIELIKRNSRRYARKQLTWFRKDKDLVWFTPDGTEKIISFLENKLEV
jgi:tRNA dimethylallyltransferase